MLDETLLIELLPPDLLIKNFVAGERDCNYEKYMLELVNKSSFFLKKSKGKAYTAPIKESNGECDCNSDDYKIDFKLIASQTACYASSNLCDQKVSIDKGARVIVISPKKTNSQIYATQIHVALRNLDYEQLCKLRTGASKNQCIESDICTFLETLETKKNLLLFFPYIFRFDKKCEFDIAVEKIQEALNIDFQHAMKYRCNVANNFDTYMSFVYDGQMIFMEEKEKSLVFVDSVKLSESETYNKLLDYSQWF